VVTAGHSAFWSFDGPVHAIGIPNKLMGFDVQP
jgi:hypothetical protein